MKSTERFVEEVIEKAKKAKKRKRIKWSVIVCSCVAALTFLVGYSNILTFDLFGYTTAYQSYLKPYLSEDGDGEQVGLKFVSDNSAIVSVGEKAYPCYVEATSDDSFVLKNSSEKALEGDLGEGDAPQAEEEPSVFYVDFWEDKAKISWNLFGVKIEKILSITEERGVPAGVWRLFATRDHTEEEITYRENGAGWTIILENGDSYTGEGMDSAWITKFVSINDKIFQCMFDPKSGVILDASVFVYDTTSFGFPVIVEHYLTDGAPYYFYSRQMTEAEKTDFAGGSFTAGAVLYESQIQSLPKEALPHESIAKWRLTHKDVVEESKLDVTAKLDLNEDGSVLLSVGGDRHYKGKTTGKWYALQHCVLVVLDEKAPLTGRVFTVYVSSDEPYGEPSTAEDYAEKARTRLELYSCYKLGYHTFHYYSMQEDVQIFWGSRYADGDVQLKIVYETPYVLNGRYFAAYFEDKNFRDEDYPINDDSGYEQYFEPCAYNGLTYLIFHEDGFADVTNQVGNGFTATKRWTWKSDGNSLEFDSSLYLSFGERKNLKIRWFHVTMDGIRAESGWYSVNFYVDESYLTDGEASL